MGRLPLPEREGFVPLMREFAFRKGQVLAAQGEMSPSLRILKTGTLLLQRRSREGRQRVVGLTGRGQTLGTFALLAQANPLSYVSSTAGRCCELDFAVARGQGVLSGRFMSGLALAHMHEFGKLTDWAHAMRMGGARDQLFAVLQLLCLEQGSSCVRLPSQTVLAELLGTTRETVARSLRVLEAQQQLVRRDRWHCELLQPVQRPPGG
ncbi:Crp/Fnr family transcriptional regulator [Variovorax sp. HJSM1_2]